MCLDCLEILGNLMAFCGKHCSWITMLARPIVQIFAAIGSIINENILGEDVADYKLK